MTSPTPVPFQKCDVIKKFPDHISNSPTFPGLWEPCHHKFIRRLPLPSSRPAIFSPASDHHSLLASTKWWCSCV